MAESKNFKTTWQFALVNKRLAEIFVNAGKILGHCYVGAKDYKTKKEKNWIINDTKTAVLNYRKGIYKNKINGEIIKSVSRLL